MSKREPRIVDIATHRRHYVSRAVAADYLGVNRRTLNKLIEAGKLPFYEFGSLQKIALGDLSAFESSARRSDQCSTSNGKGDIDRHT